MHLLLFSGTWVGSISPPSWRCPRRGRQQSMDDGRGKGTQEGGCRVPLLPCCMQPPPLPWTARPHHLSRVQERWGCCGLVGPSRVRAFVCHSVGMSSFTVLKLERYCTHAAVSQCFRKVAALLYCLYATVAGSASALAWVRPCTAPVSSSAQELARGPKAEPRGSPQE